MAKKANYSADVIQHEKHKKVTSIGRAARCTPKNKNKRAQWKRYRGTMQGLHHTIQMTYHQIVNLVRYMMECRIIAE